MSAAAASSEELNSGKRQRVSKACDLCRRKKIKCDGTMPVCGNCQAFNYDCSYNDTTKKRGPPKGYIEAVENRLEKLERILEDIAKENNDPKLLAELNTPLETPTGEIIKSRPVRRHQRTDSLKKRRLGSNDDNRSRQSPMSLSQICFADSPPSGHLSYPDSMPSSPDSAEDSTGQLSMDENGQVRYLGKSSGYYLLQGSRTYQNGAFHFTGYNHKVTSKKKPTDLDPLELPPKDLSEHLINLYFENFYPFLPLFYKRRLTSSLDSALEPVSPLLLNAIYAIASRISPDVRVRSDPASADTAGDIFVERAKYLLDSYYDIPRISTVQALLLLASHQHGTMHFVRGWMYSGMAFRMAQDLGLHRNCDHWNIPPDERERRKRVFWCCFIVDRLISAIYGRSSTFEERDCDVPFPSVDDDEIEPGKPDTSGPPRPKVLETFIHLTKISDILGHVLRNIYYAKARHHGSPQHLEHVLNGLNRELTNWYNNLPPALQYRLPDTESGETARDPPLPISQIHMLYYTTVILLHRPFIPGPSHPAPTTSLPSYKICISAAKSILDIVNVMLSEDHLKYVYNYAVYCVFTAGIVFIKMASSDEADKAFDAKIYINKIMRALDEIEGTWMNAARCCNILGELAGLREINLECSGYAPRRLSKVANPPPSIAVPNSPEKESASNFAEEQQQQQQQQQQTSWETPAFASNHSTYTAQNMLDQLKTSATVDPFAAPGVVPSSQQQYDPLHTAFWGVPPSLDMEEWTKYFGTQSNQDASLQGPPILSSSAQPLIPSHEFSPMQVGRQSTNTVINDANRRGDGGLARPSVHNDQNVDMLSGVSLPLNLPDTPAGSVLLGFLANQERANNQQSDNPPTSS